MSTIVKYRVNIDGPATQGGLKEVRMSAYSVLDAIEKIIASEGDVMIYDINFPEPKKLSEIALEPSAPAAVSDLTATAASATEVVIDHTPIDRATFYEYTVAATGVDPLAADVVRYTAADLPLTVGDLTTATGYDFTVRAINAYGASAWCTPVTETTE